MKNLNNYIREGFFQNVGTKNPVNMLVDTLKDMSSGKNGWDNIFRENKVLVKATPYIENILLEIKELYKDSDSKGFEITWEQWCPTHFGKEYKKYSQPMFIRYNPMDEKITEYDGASYMKTTDFYKVAYFLAHEMENYYKADDGKIKDVVSKSINIKYF